MKQLVLDIGPDADPTFENFVASGNEALIDALLGAIRGASHLYLWGPRGCGRTHLLKAAVTTARAAGRAAELHAGESIDTLPATNGLLLCIDDVDALDEPAQIALFNAFNRAAHARQTLLLSGETAPLGLALREDLRTRIGQCLVFEVQPLDDETRSAILRQIARRRGLELADELIGFLLRHGSRELPRLISVVEALDRASLERKRPVTLPLLRELIQLGLEI
ncbi:MAG: DnaA regulatory inactivator Hda [Rhodocyclaceae bacterium]|jgi:DnaA family protein|nr:DnaA regulatory inactivator Hda [Rhodocyclaceae bacterium]